MSRAGRDVERERDRHKARGWFDNRSLNVTLNQQTVEAGGWRGPAAIVPVASRAGQQPTRTLSRR
jgi:hypothetical protein